MKTAVLALAILSSSVCVAQHQSDYRAEYYIEIEFTLTSVMRVQGQTYESNKVFSVSVPTTKKVFDEVRLGDDILNGSMSVPVVFRGSASFSRAIVRNKYIWYFKNRDKSSNQTLPNPTLTNSMLFSK